MFLSKLDLSQFLIQTILKIKHCMKTSICLLILPIFLFSFGCNTTIECENIKDTYSNTQLYKVDTIYRNVNIEHTNCTIKIVSNKFDENGKKYEEVNKDEWWLNEAPTSIVIYNNENCKLVFHKKLEGVKVNILKQKNNFSKEGKIFLHVISSGGGSGFTAWIHQFIFVNGQLQLNEIMQTDELSSILMHENEKDIYVVHGIWDMSGWNENGEGESHFSAHKQKIIRYKSHNQFYRKEYLGTTQNLYDTEAKTAIQLFQEIIRYEKGLLPANIKPIEYNSLNNWEGTFDKHE